VVLCNIHAYACMQCTTCQQGKRWSNDDVLQILDEYEPWLDITTTTDNNSETTSSEDYSAVIAHAAQALAAGSVVGWYQGRSEYGPRALGSRSILADPRGAATADYINAAVKKREDFRPFAPSVLLEHASEWFCGIDSSTTTSGSNSGSGASPYMSITVPVKEDKRSQVHVYTPYISTFQHIYFVKSVSHVSAHAVRVVYMSAYVADCCCLLLLCMHLDYAVYAICLCTHD
jgi:predicted NodU family carbamoyl transferase